MAIRLQDTGLFDEANRANSAQSKPEDSSKWGGMTYLKRENRRVSIAGYGGGSQNELAWNLVEEDAKEILEKVALDGEEALLVPR
jgi:hypothetical protein